MAEESYVEYLELAMTLARKAGKLIMERFASVQTYADKRNHADSCTETDRQAETLIFSAIRERFPEHRCIGEESQEEEGKQYFTDDVTWIVDPIDGTTNFIHGDQHVCTSIGVCVKKQPVVGVVYNPVKDELYTAQIGKGAFCNGKPIHVSKETDLKRALVLTEFLLYSTMEEVDLKMTNMRTLVQNCHGIRGNGSSAYSMCLLARGVFDGHFEMGLHCWDMAAGALIVTEAGGTVTDVNGGPFQLMSRRVIAGCTATIADQLAKLVTTRDYQPDCLT